MGGEYGDCERGVVGVSRVGLGDGGQGLVEDGSMAQLALRCARLAQRWFRLEGSGAPMTALQ